MQSRRVRKALLVAAVSFCCGTVNGAGPDGQESVPSAVPAAEQSALAVEHDAEIADAIRKGAVLEEMTMQQVLSARGEPIRMEVIPPDAELWHYAEGEVAFSNGKVSYVDLDALRVRETTPAQSPSDEGTPLIPGKPAADKRGAPNTARVHAPGDGFLALRSEPTIRWGQRLLKIPHATVLTLGECVTPPGDGRWCRTTFQGKVGWVFDRYLVR